MGAPNSVPIRIGGRGSRALVDTRVEVSVISCRIYESLRQRPELQKKDMQLRTVNGSPLQVDGLFQVQKGNQSIPHDYIVVKNLNRNIILGRDFLMQNGVRM